MTRKFVRLLAVVVAIAALTLTFSGAALAEDTIKMGVAGPHTGDLASYGIPTLRAAEYVTELYNAKGGVLGKKIELAVADDVCKPEVATNVATKLVSEGVKLVLGHICSSATIAALGIYTPEKVIIMSPSATNVDLTQSGEYPNFFRTIAPDDAQSNLQYNLAKKMGLKKIAVLHDKDDYGKGLAELVKKSIEADADMEVVLFEGITVGAVDYSAAVQKVKQSGAEAVIYGGYHPEASKLVMQMRKKKIDIPFISDDGVQDITFIKVAGEFAEGVYATGPRDTSKNPMAQEAIKYHQKKYGADPGAFYINAVAAMFAMLNAIEKAGAVDYDKITNALRTDEVDTPLGRMKFDARGDAEGVGFLVYQVQNGKFVELK